MNEKSVWRLVITDPKTNVVQVTFAEYKDGELFRCPSPHIRNHGQTPGNDATQAPKPS